MIIVQEAIRLQLKSDLRGIETDLDIHECILPIMLKSDLRGIETTATIPYRYMSTRLKSDLRGIETRLFHALCSVHQG